MDDLCYVDKCLAREPATERTERFHSDGRLRQILPEVYALQDVRQPKEYHPEGDALVHTLLAVRHLPAGADRRLAWAALLHDIGKAETTRTIDGRVRSFDHDRAGADMAANILARLGAPPALCEDVSWLVRHHMFAISWQVGSFRQLSHRQKRFMGQPLFPLLVELMTIDALASGPNSDKLQAADFYRRSLGLLEEGP